jgi:hypothetical protein
MGQSIQGNQQPPQPQGANPVLNPQMMAYLRAKYPGLVAQQMGNSAPGMTGGEGLSNGITRALLGGNNA